ncbi:hypothetical protein NP233_g8372 [Leucocoprinus birnbaumii]|uniref:SH3 domain-containing protein n=1 Tax=Leucocoprinus birnbaumii TaxID=56174 RepID=A0AAD5VR12_9AGAR|nr:hypothetical protein NP233_g8372 [Leucocoprinus birnbaumii]
MEDHRTSPTGTGTGNSPSSSSSGSPTSSNGGDFVSSNGNTPVNAGEDPSESDSGSGGSSSGGSDGKTGSSGGGTTKAGGSVPGATGMPTTTDADGGFGGNVGGGSGGGNGGSGIEGAGASQNHGLTKGAIAGIVVVVILAAIGVTVVLLRRRLRSRRTERRNNWFFSRNRTSQTYGDRAHGDLGISGGRAGSGGRSAGQRRSVRSSFETTVDHSVTPRLDMDFDIPALPPMAELRGTPMLVNLDSPVSPVNGVRAPEINITTTPQSRFSVGTVSSLSSDGQGQWLVVNRDTLAPEVGTPMSVRPFSPTESFAFPKPPTEKSSGDWGSQFSRPASAHTLNASFNSGVRSPSSHALGVGITEEEVPALPIPSPAANPFNDPDPIALHAAAVVALGVGQGTPANIDVAAANKIQDPFADPTFPPEPLNPSPVHPEFMEIETIRRPFIPTLDDELGVELGDKVRIMQMFDDGWALVEKNPVYGKASVKGKGKQPEKGLIPIDCFRDHGLELSQFIASKRVSSYSQSSSKYTAGGAAF